VRRILPLTIVLGLAGCAHWFEAQIRESYAAPDSSRRDAVWAAALDELEGRRFPVQVSEPARGLIRTAVVVQPGRVPCGVWKCRFRDAVEVWVGEDASVRVKLNRELAGIMIVPLPGGMLADEDWYKPWGSQQATVKGIEADQDAILAAILERARWAP